MNQFKPIALESHDILLHPLRMIDFPRTTEIENDIYEIFSNPSIVSFLHGQPLMEKKDKANFLTGVVIGYHTGMEYTHFITQQEINKVIGVIKMISPKRAEKLYRMESYNWMIEYYLREDFQGQGIMAGLVAEVCRRMKSQGITTVSAVCDRKNQKSINVLLRNGFRYIGQFDIRQDYYQLDMNSEH